LAERFPQDIRCVCAKLNEQVVAGTILFVTRTTYHAQYIASSDKGYEVAGLDLVFDHAINRAVGDGKRWFDFGVSTESQGNVLNDGLYRFKTEFGGGGFVHEFYEIDFTRKECHATQ
jgi:lipid II:glycine glycyltransferase (peptidoglycan interpeptide bridge formation enzyme)